MIVRAIRYVQRLREAYGDWRLGIRTEEWQTACDPSRPDFRGYGPTHYRDWRVISRHIVASPTASFIDYGAGLGRVAILAGRLPFAQVIGVDLDPDLIGRAKRNVEQCRAATLAPITMVCADATSFAVPDNATVFYFNNPFTGVTLTKVLENILKSVASSPRQIQLICNVPILAQGSQFEKEIAANAAFRLNKSFPLGDRRCLIFSQSSKIEQ